MKRLACVLAVCAVVAFLSAGVGIASADRHPSQGYGGGEVQGWVYGYTMYDELIPLEWVDITASNGQYRFTTQSWADGGYHMFLPVGMFDLTASEPGYVSYSLSITVSDGASLNGINFYLEQSHVPIPEFPINMVSLLMIATLVGALLVKRAVKRLPTAETA